LIFWPTRTGPTPSGVPAKEHVNNIPNRYQIHENQVHIDKISIPVSITSPSINVMMELI
jgi:hypothetical protein